MRMVVRRFPDSSYSKPLSVVGCSHCDEGVAWHCHLVLPERVVSALVLHFSDSLQ